MEWREATELRAGGGERAGEETLTPPYLEWRGRVRVHLDHWRDENHAGEIVGSLAGREDGNGATLRMINTQRIDSFIC